jgi:hypothetical protein
MLSNLRAAIQGRPPSDDLASSPRKKPPGSSTPTTRHTDCEGPHRGHFTRPVAALVLYTDVYIWAWSSDVDRFDGMRIAPH